MYQAGTTESSSLRIKGRLYAISCSVQIIDNTLLSSSVQQHGFINFTEKSYCLYIKWRYK